MTSVADRAVVAAIAFMFAVIPLYGTFGVLDPLRPPIPPLVGVAGAVAIAVAMLAAAVLCAWGALRRPPPLRLAVAQLGAGLAIVPAALLGFDPPTGLELALIVLAMGAVGVALYGHAPLPGALRTIVACTLASGAAAALLALAMIALRRPAALYAYNNGRAVGTFLNPNELAAYMLVLIGLAAGVALFGPGNRLRALAALAVVAGGAALGETFSRWAFFAAIAGLVYFAVLLRRRRVWLGLGLAIVCALAVVAGPGAAHHNPRDDASRLVAWSAGWQTVVAFPLTGVGPFAFNRTYDLLRAPQAPGGAVPVAYDPHSLPLAYLAESGIVGFGTLVLGWCIYIAEIRRTLRAAPARRRALVYALAAGLVALNVHVLVNTISIYFALGTQGAALALALAQRDIDAPAG